MTVTIDEHRNQLRVAIAELFQRFHKGELAPSNFIDPGVVDAHLATSGVDYWMETKMVAEADILPFRHLDAEDTGYAAASIRNLPVRNHIHSFEPMSLYNPMLQRLSEIDTRYSFSNIACSDHAADRKAFNLVVNRTLIGGTTSIDGIGFQPWFTDYVVLRLGENWFGVADHYRAQLVQADFVALPLDEVVFDLRWLHHGRPITGLKIDVEGHEFEAISGAKRTLTHHHPLLMVETLDVQRMAPVLASLGYLHYERDGDIIKPIVTPFYNAYFAHETRIREYERLGLIPEKEPGPSVWQRLRSSLSAFMNK
jgi:hypothetical protein